MTAREAALEVLIRVEQDGAYSNLLLNQTLQKAGLERNDSGLATELVYGAIQRRNTLDYYISLFVSKGASRLEPWVRALLRLSVYQLVYLDRIPAHAAVNEAVAIAKRRGHAGISGMINAVLRSMIREPERLRLPEQGSAASRLALEFSHPEWLVARWLKQFGEAATADMCRANNEPPHVSLRVNRLRTSREALLAELAAGGYDARPSEVAPAGIIVRGGGNMALTDGYRSGVFSIQDESSMLVAEAVAPEKGMLVLDCCAAPGGKTVHMAELMNNQGTIYAVDQHEHKRQLIDAQADRLGLACITSATADARHLAGRFPEASFDRVLLDAPCSGLGVIRRKPDVKWTKTPEEITALAALQRELLESAAPLVKPGGVLVYSTCTVEPLENSGQVEAFLKRHPEFAPDPLPAALYRLPAQGPNRLQGGSSLDGGQRAAGGASVSGTSVSRAAPAATEAEAELHSACLQILPHHYGTDGFFIARMRRKAEYDKI
ncbi:16S rRNA (cytosine(967)-C(5))-methyltransferase RsmB [Paenibacillus sp. y28]|uniref:16S rRNA (cytosine(967)-C(5))-methyltransferase RsmB n=1 Tax=Paenibacillus sp. y28 TaxID=3129110 RepID=UPI0030169F42